MLHAALSQLAKRFSRSHQSGGKSPGQSNDASENAPRAMTFLQQEFFELLEAALPTLRVPRFQRAWRRLDSPVLVQEVAQFFAPQAALLPVAIHRLSTRAAIGGPI
jgi:hypothetical protein